MLDRNQVAVYDGQPALHVQAVLGSSLMGGSANWNLERVVLLFRISEKGWASGAEGVCVWGCLCHPVR